MVGICIPPFYNIHISCLIINGKIFNVKEVNIKKWWFWHNNKSFYLTTTIFLKWKLYYYFIVLCIINVLGKIVNPIVLELHCRSTEQSTTVWFQIFYILILCSIIFNVEKFEEHLLHNFGFWSLLTMCHYWRSPSPAAVWWAATANYCVVEWFWNVLKYCWPNKSYVLGFVHSWLQESLKRHYLHTDY